jgi:exo-beta-1,3-glucanase (GH17 family)
MVGILLGCLRAGTVPSYTTAIAPFFTYIETVAVAPALVAFNPTQYDPRPGATRTIPSLASVQADLAALRPAFDGLILYAYDPEVTPTIVAESARQGFRAVLLGIWEPTSATELTGTVALIQQYYGTLALAVCIGNEGLTFTRYTLRDLQTAADRLKASLGPDVPVPFTTSEPFDQYDQTALQQFGDFLAPNIHTVFTQPAQAAAAAAAWVRERAHALATSTGRRVLVKETGMPHGGAPQFTPATQQAFWAAYVKGERVVRIPGGWVAYNAAFEAVDLPWKAALTHIPLEEAWGLLSTERQPYPAFFVWTQLRNRAWHRTTREQEDRP